jgi:hypothetical protein
MDTINFGTMHIPCNGGYHALTIHFAQVHGVDEELAAARVDTDADAGLGGEVVHLHGRTLERNRHSLPYSEIESGQQMEESGAVLGSPLPLQSIRVNLTRQ